MTRVYLGLGANINPAISLRAGMAALSSTFANVKHSPVYQTQAVNRDGPDFLNMVASFDCHLALDALRHWIATTETRHGRIRLSVSAFPKKTAAKTPTKHGLDMDILLFGDLISPAHNIPRRDIWHHAYVLKPLADLAPQLVCPTDTQTVQDLWQHFALRQRIEQVSLE